MKFYCGGCDKKRSSSSFYLKSRTKPPVRRSDWSSRCDECVKKYKKNYYRLNAKKLNKLHKEQRLLNHNDSLRKEAARRLAKSSNKDAILRRRTVASLSPRDAYLNQRLTQWRSSAKKRGLAFSLGFDDLLSLIEKQKGLCAYTGKPLVFAPNSRATISVDRINSSQGYLLDNVVVCWQLVNLMKLDLSVSEFRSVIALIHSHLSHGV